MAWLTDKEGRAKSEEMKKEGGGREKEEEAEEGGRGGGAVPWFGSCIYVCVCVFVCEGPPFLLPMPLFGSQGLGNLPSSSLRSGGS